MSNGISINKSDLQGLSHYAAHDRTHTQCGLHVQFLQGGFQLVNGNQPCTDRRGRSTQKIQLPADTFNNTDLISYINTEPRFPLNQTKDFEAKYIHSLKTTICDQNK